MKKKILLLTLMLALFVFAFALSVSAASSNEFGEVEILSGMSEKSSFGLDGTVEGYTSRIVLYDGTEYHTYPAYYILTNSKTPSLTFDEIKAATGKEYANTSIIRVEVPENITRVSSIFRSNSNLVYVHLPDTLIRVDQDGFHGCSGLKYINIPRDCVSVGNYAFNGCTSLEEFDMTEATSLTSIGSHNLGSSKLTSLVFPEGFKEFNGISCATLKTIVFPNSTTKIGVLQCSGLEEVVVPPTITALGNKTFDYCSSLKKVTLPNGLTSIVTGSNPTFFGTTLTNLNEIVYTGSEDDAIVEVLKTVVPKATITYANHCEVYYNGEHEVQDINACVDKCEKCFEIYAKANPEHDLTTVIDYLNGFAASGTKTVCCANEGCPLNLEAQVTSVSAIFNGFVYSTREENGTKYGMVLSYCVDTEALLAYEANKSTTLSYGVLAIAKANVSGSPLDISGAPTTNESITTSVTGTPSVDLIIWGAKSTWDSMLQSGITVKELEFYVVGYVTENDSLEYFCGEASSTDITALTAVSYNGIKAMA